MFRKRWVLTVTTLDTEGTNFYTKRYRTKFGATFAMLFLTRLPATAYCSISED